MAAVCALSVSAAATSIASVTADAATTSISASAKSGTPYIKTLKGNNWNYSADSLCAKITCDFNYNTSTCKFKATGVTPGTTNAVLKVEVADGKWKNVPMRFSVDKNLNVHGSQSDKEYFTKASKTENTGTKKDTKKNTNKNTNKNKKSGSKSESKPTAKSCTFKMTGFDWNYSADSLNVKITCDFDYSTKTCKFIGKAVKEGTTNATLKAKRADGKWNNTPVRFTVDKNLNIKVTQTGDSYVTK